MARQPGSLPCVYLVAPLQLLAQAIGAALGGRHVDVVLAQGDLPVMGEDDVLLLVDDLVDSDALSAARRLIAASRANVLVLTSRERDHTWGALLAAGASTVLSSTSSLDEVEAAIRGAGDEPGPGEIEARAQLVGEWERFRSDHHEFSARLARLSPRERTVLSGLCGGVAVAELAEQLGVAETTVRSQVKSILRKLGVRSQLAAVAVVRRIEPPTLGALVLAGVPRRRGVVRAAD